MGDLLKRLFSSDLAAPGCCQAWEHWGAWGVWGQVLLALLALSCLILAGALRNGIRRRREVLRLQQALSQERDEHRATRKELLESRERVRGLIEGMQDYAIIMLDPMGLVVSWNPGAERISGFLAEEILGQPFSCFYSAEEVAAGLPEAHLGTAKAHEHFSEEGWRCRKNGSRYPARVTLTALRDAQGFLTGFAKVTRDLTLQREAQALLLSFNQDLETRVQATALELSRSDARLQGFIRHAPAAIAFKSPDGRFLLINLRMEALLGRPPEQILDRGYGDLFPESLGSALRASEQEVLATGQALQVEEQWQHADGTRHDYLTQKFPLLDPSGQCWGLGLISTDITERKEAERTQLRGQKLESLGILAGGIAHDFNNLLGAILGNLGLAQMELPPLAAARTRLDTLEALVVKASDLTRQMLAYSGRGTFVVTAVDLNLLVTEMTHLLELSISKKAVLQYQLQAELPTMDADSTQIQQVIMNLVINASEAMAEHGGHITLRTASRVLDPASTVTAHDGRHLAPGSFVALEVADDGAGMSPDTMKQMFDPFFTTKFTGRGLGLAAIQGILRSHHGGIQVHSELGRGTVFTLLFPASIQPLAPLTRPQEPAAFQGSGKVLVVDDEEGIRAVAMSILERTGFEPISASDGREALRLFEQHRGEIRLILMDLTMPNLDGEDTYRALRQRGARTPVLLSSGFNETEAIHRFQGKGLAGFIQKPYRATALIEMVRKALEKGAKDPTS